MKTQRRILVSALLGALCGAVGCATVAPKPPEVESVGTLTESTTHVAQAPVHATTDLTPSYAPASADDDGGEVVTTASKVEPPAPSAPSVASKGIATAPAVASTPLTDETPDIAPKSAHGF